MTYQDNSRPTVYPDTYPGRGWTWTTLAEDMVYWRTFMNTIVNTRRERCSVECLSPSQKKLHSMESNSFMKFEIPEALINNIFWV